MAESGAWSEAEVRAWGARFLELARDEVSATGVRHALAAGDGAGVAGGAEVRGGGALDPDAAECVLKGLRETNVAKVVLESFGNFKRFLQLHCAFL